MLASGITEYMYKDLVKGVKHHYICDDEQPEEFIIQEKQEKEF